MKDDFKTLENRLLFLLTQNRRSLFVKCKPKSALGKGLYLILRGSKLKDVVGLWHFKKIEQKY